MLSFEGLCRKRTSQGSVERGPLKEAINVKVNTFSTCILPVLALHIQFQSLGKN